MKDFTIIVTNGNVPGEDKEYIVHKKGCRDVERMKSMHLVHTYDASAESAEAVVKQEAQEFIDCDMGWDEKDFKICPCARK